MTVKWWHGPVLLALIQVAPVTVHEDSLGRVRIHLGLATSRFEDRTLSCSGSVLSADPVETADSGVRVDALAGSTRFTAFGGLLNDTGEYDGPYGGFQIALEGRYAGVGIGATHVSGSDEFTGPSLCLRFAHLDGPHAILEILPPTESLSMTGWARVGVGYNRGRKRGTSGLIALDIPMYSDEAYPVGASGLCSMPVSRGVALNLRGRVAGSETHPNWGVGAGVTFDLNP